MTTDAAWSEDAGAQDYCDDVRFDELTNGLVRLSVGAGHADLELAELERVLERAGVLEAIEKRRELAGQVVEMGRAAVRPGRLELERPRGEPVQWDNLRKAVDEIAGIEKPLELAAVEAEYTPPKKEK